MPGTVCVSIRLPAAAVEERIVLAEDNDRGSHDNEGKLQAANRDEETLELSS
jgi:hypothetical protein